MPSEKQVYSSDAERYEALVAREDFQHNIEKALDGIVRVDGLDVIDLGAGTGRLAGMLAARVRSMRAFDLSPHMLTVTRDKIGARSLVAAADHRHIPVAADSADVILSGWSVSYLAVWDPEHWRAQLDGWLDEVRRVLRPRGTVILLESLGTGNEAPKKLEHLSNFYPWLDETGFENKWIRTDYQFASLEEAARLAGFFFGEEMGKRIEQEKLTILPECTGVWWKRL